MVQGATATTARAVSEAMTGPLTQTPYIPEEFKPAGDATSVGLFNAAHDDQPYDPTPTQAQTLKMAYTQATAGVEGGLSDGLLVQAAYNEDIDPRTGRKKDDGVMQEALSQSQRLLQERLDELDAQIAQLIQDIEELEEENRKLDNIQKAFDSRDPDQVQAALDEDPTLKAKLMAEFEKRTGRKADVNDPAEIAILHGISEDFEDENMQSIAKKIEEKEGFETQKSRISEVSNEIKNAEPEQKADIVNSLSVSDLADLSGRRGNTDIKEVRDAMEDNNIDVTKLDNNASTVILNENNAIGFTLS